MGMTTKTDTEQLRAEFEAWASQYTSYPQKYDLISAWQAYQAGRAALQLQDREDAERYRYLITKLQQSYDGDYIEIDPMSLYCHMQSQFKGDRVIGAEITWGSEAGESIGLSEAIDHARRIEGDGNG